MKKVVIIFLLGISLSFGGIDNICLKMNDNFKTAMDKFDNGDKSALKDIAYYANETVVSCSQVTGEHKSQAEELVYYAKRVLTAFKEMK